MINDPTFYELTPDKIQAYYDKGYELICSYREEGVKKHPDVTPTKEWFQRRMDQYAFKLFWERPFKREDKSDKYYESLSADKKIKFRQREIKRFKIGHWVKVPDFWELPEEEQIALRKEYPTAGWVQLMSPGEYFKMHYGRLKIISEHGGDGITNPYPFKRGSMFFDQMYILLNYSQCIGKFDREGMFIFKKRAAQLTTNFFFATALNVFFVKKGYTSGIAFDQQAKIKNNVMTFKQILGLLPNWIKPRNPLTKKPTYRMVKDGPVWSRFEVWFWDEDKNKENVSLQNTILFRDHIPGSWEQPRLDDFFVDESGKCDYDVIELWEKGGATMMDPYGRIRGVRMMGGTSDESNDKNNPEFLKIIEDPTFYKGFNFFVGIQHTLYTDEFTGVSDEERAIRETLARRQNLRETGNISILAKERSISPVSIHDCLLSKGIDYIDTEAIAARVKDIVHIQNTPTHEEFYTIKRGMFKPGKIKRDITPGGKLVEGPRYDYLNPELIPNADGGWHIIEMPDKTIINADSRKKSPQSFYFAGVDNADARIVDDKELARTNEGKGKSRMSVVIYRIRDRNPIAYYLYRHGDPKKDYEQILLGCIFYNSYAFIEENKPRNIEYFIDFQGHPEHQYPKYFFSKWLFPTPEIMGGNYKKGFGVMKTDYGIKTQGSPNSPFGKIKLYEEYEIPYWEENIDIQMFPEILETFKTWDINNKKGTPDIGMAHMIGLIGMDYFIKTFMPKRFSSENDPLINFAKNMSKVGSWRTSIV